MKNKPLIDNIIKTIVRKTQEEVSALLGYQVEVGVPENRVISKADFFGLTADKLVLTDLKVTGDKEGVAFLIVTLADAILLGGTLLMLPPKELENRISTGEFDEEAADAFGEIANIITGVFAAVFDDLYSGKLHFTKVGLEMVAPTKVDLESSDPIPPQSYYLTSSPMKMDGRDIGSMQVLFPLDIFGWEEAAAQAETGAGAGAETGAEAAPAGPSAPGEESAPSTDETAAAAATPEEGAAPASEVAPQLVLVVSDDRREGQNFIDSLEEGGFQVKLIDAQDNIKAQLPGGAVRGVFLVMKKVNEKGIALVIKVRSACGESSPLLAAGPNWTRNAVIQAVKYGACDIIMTPVSPEEIREKAEAHLGHPDSSN